MAKLTDKSFATAVTLNSLIHIVNTGDTTQSALGSSYKAELSQLVPLFGSNPDVTVTGGTYNPSTGEVTFYNNTGGTFNVSGFVTGFTDSFVSGGTYTAGTATFTNTTGGTFAVTGFNETNIYNSDGVLTGVRIIDMNTYPLAFSGGSSDLLFGFIGTADKHIQWSETGPLNWDMVVNTGTNDFALDRYDSLGGYLDTPFTVDFSNGNVGVKQQSPSETLDVSGKTKTINFQMTSGATNGYVLTSDVSGNASWQSGATVNLYNSDGTLTGNRTITQGNYDLDLDGNENSRLQTSYTSTINPLDNGSFASRLTGTFFTHNDDTNDIYFSASLFPGNSSMNVGVISTNVNTGINFNSSKVSLTHYDGVSITKEVAVDISGISVNQEYYFPNTDGSDGQILKTDGSGTTYWANACDCPYTGGTVTGATTFTGGLSATSVTGNTIWAEKIRGKFGPIQFNDTDGGNIYFGSTSGITLDVINRRIGIGTTTPTTDLDVTGKTRTATLQVTSGATNGYVLTSDGSGNATWQVSSGGVSINPYNNLGNVSLISWDVSGVSTNYEATLTGNTTLNLTNVRNGEYGTIIITQDGTGGRTLTFGTVNGSGTTHRVANGGGGTPTLTSNPSAIDILTFTYNGSIMYWTVGNDYT